MCTFLIWWCFLYTQWIMQISLPASLCFTSHLITKYHAWHSVHSEDNAIKTFNEVISRPQQAGVPESAVTPSKKQKLCYRSWEKQTGRWQHATTDLSGTVFLCWACLDDSMTKWLLTFALDCNCTGPVVYLFCIYSLRELIIFLLYYQACYITEVERICS